VQHVVIGKIKVFASLVLCVAALTACSPTPETIGEMARTSIQDVLRVDPRFEGTGITVVGVKLTAEGERQYKGIASIKHNGVVHEVPVSVLVDGLSIKWDTAPDAFAFMPQIKPPK
jgi:hypothetical protein